jgi:hypothetical protein
MKAPALLLIVLVLAWSNATAQTPADVATLEKASFTATQGTLEDYGRLYHRGQYRELATRLREDLDGIAWRGARPDFSSRYTSIVVVVRPPAEKDRALVRMLLPPAGPVLAPPHRMPGVDMVYEVFLSYDGAARMESSWVSTPEEYPLRGQLAKLAETAFPSLAALVEPAPDRLIDTTVYVTVNEVRLPRRRASLKVTTRVHEAPRLGPAAVALGSAVARGPARLSRCALALSDTLRGTLGAATTPTVASSPAASGEGLPAELASKTAKHLRTKLCEDEVAGEGDGGLKVARAEAVADVANRYLAVAAGRPDPITGTAELRNLPPMWLSVGLVGGVMLTRGGDKNFQVSDGATEEDALSGPVTAAVLHLHLPYDPETPDISPQERFSVFGGIAATPTAGFAVGASLRLFRGLGVQVSHVWLRADRLRPEFDPGQAVTGSDDPFELGFTRSIALGISYDLK